MTVSIITATYNSATTIKDTLQSVQQQTYPFIEHIIVYGVSTDNTLDIVAVSAHKGFVHQGKDKGIYDAMNKGISLCNGDIIGILNSDDFYADETVIEKVVALFKDTNCKAVYGDLVYVDANNTNQITRTWISGDYRKNNFLYGWMPPHPTFFVRKELYQQFGTFNLALWGAADYELMLRFLYKHNVETAYLNKVLVHMRSGGQSNVSIKNRIRANMEDRKAWKLNALKPRWYTLFLKPIRKITQFFIKTKG